MKVFTIEYQVDLGSHVIKVFSSEKLANKYIPNLESGDYEIREYELDSNAEYGKLIKKFSVE